MQPAESIFSDPWAVTSCHCSVTYPAVSSALIAPFINSNRHLAAETVWHQVLSVRPGLAKLLLFNQVLLIDESIPPDFKLQLLIEQEG